MENKNKKETAVILILLVFAITLIFVASLTTFNHVKIKELEKRIDIYEKNLSLTKEKIKDNEKSILTIQEEQTKYFTDFDEIKMYFGGVECG